MYLIVPLLTLGLLFGLALPACSEAGPPQAAFKGAEAKLADDMDTKGTTIMAAANIAIATTPLAHHESKLACIKGDPALGKTQYDMFCTTCHGATGDGDGPASAVLDPKPARHSDGGYMNTLSNETLSKTISGGGSAVGKSPLMAAWGGVLNDQQLLDVVAYVRSLAKEPAYACP